MTITNFSQVLVGDARTWLKITEAQHPEKSKKWQSLKILFEKEFKTQADDNERRTQIKTLTQRRNESARAFSYRVQHTLLVVNDTMSKLPADVTLVQKVVTKALKEKKRIRRHALLHERTNGRNQAENERSARIQRHNVRREGKTRKRNRTKNHHSKKSRTERDEKRKTDHHGK